MLRRILIAGIIILGAACSYMVWIRSTKPSTEIVHIQNEIKESTELPPRQIVPEEILKINNRNSQINNFSAGEVSVKIWERGMRFRLEGTLDYEKRTRFRMKIESAFGEELDLGANDEVFWYWSRRDKRPAVYFATYENFNKTRLKTPFNPIFMKEALGLDVIDLDKAKISETEDNVILKYNRIDSMNRPILYWVFLDKSQNLIDGLLVTNPEGKPLASAEIKEFDLGLPKKILFVWYEEDKVLEIEFKNPKANVALKPSNWVLPNRDPKIDMSEE